MTSREPYATKVGMAYAAGVRVRMSRLVSPNSAASMLNTRRTMDWYPPCAPASVKSCATKNASDSRGVNTMGLSRIWKATSGSSRSR